MYTSSTSALHPSALTSITNHLTDAMCAASVYGAAGLLAARVFKQLDPRVGLVYGVTIGALFNIFQAEGANTSSLVLSTIAIIALPSNICQKLGYPVTRNIALILTIGFVAPRMIWEFASK